MAGKFNVILIGVDTLRADHLGSYNYTRNTSPNIDAIAREGVLFENCFSQAPITSPSFMSIMTSRYPTYHGIVDNICPSAGGRTYVLDKSVPTFADILKADGYRTGAFTGGGCVNGDFGFARGFDYYLNGVKERKGWGEGGRIPEKDIFYWLQECRNENFFLFFHTYSVHNPWFAERSFLNIFNTSYDGKLLIRKDFPPTRSYRAKSSTYEFFKKQINKQDPTDIQYFKDIYDGAIRYVDDFIGRLRQQLDQLGILENTVIVITADHGEEFSEHGKFGHCQLYNEVLHVPLIFYHKGVLEQKRISQRVRSIDIVPTIAQMLGITIQTPIHGKPLQGAIAGESLERIPIADVEHYGQAIQYGRYKYIFPRYRRRALRIDELYDLESDPSEKKNIAFEHMDVVEDLISRYDAELHVPSFPRPQRHVVYLALENLLRTEEGA